MKTIQVEDHTWEMLQERKLKWRSPTLSTVIDRLIIDSEPNKDGCVQINKDGEDKK
jgi:hypothetical protein